MQNNIPIGPETARRSPKVALPKMNPKMQLYNNPRMFGPIVAGIQLGIIFKHTDTYSYKKGDFLFFVTGYDLWLKKGNKKLEFNNWADLCRHETFRGS